MTHATIHLVPSLILAALPTPRAEVPEVAPFPHDLARRVVGASVRIRTCPTMIHPTPEPRSARRHVALEGA